jgi:hypothetical protein
MMRGGDFGGSTYAGVFAVQDEADPTLSDSTYNVGFRCAR